MALSNPTFSAWGRATRLDNEAIARRAYRLGARYATVKKMFGTALTESRNKSICDELGLRRISGQSPQTNDALYGAQMRNHLTIFFLFLENQPPAMPSAWRIVEAYEAYARVVVKLDDSGTVVDANGSPLSRESESGLPRLSFDRAEYFARSSYFTMNKSISLGRCHDCRTPFILRTHESSASYLCAYCTDRLIAGRPRQKRQNGEEGVGES